MGELIDEFEADLREKNYQQAYEAAQESETILGAMLAAGLGALSCGHAKSMEAVEDALATIKKLPVTTDDLAGPGHV